MCGVIRVREESRPARSGPLKDELNVLVFLLEVVGGGERIEDTPERFFASARIGKHDDGGFGGGHGEYSCGREGEAP